MTSDAAAWLVSGGVWEVNMVVIMILTEGHKLV